MCAACLAAATCLPAGCAAPQAPETAGIAWGKDVRLHISRTTLCTIPKDLGMGCTVVSPDGRHVVVIAPSRSGKYLAVIDGGLGKEYDYVRPEPVFSPNSKRVLYIATNKEKKIVVVDGAEGKAYDAVLGATFSPDSRHVAYLGRRGGTMLVVRDGVEHKAKAWIEGLTHPPVFSPDSKRLAWVAARGKPGYNTRQSVVVDGVAGREYDAVGPGSLVFSPDSKRVAYTAYVKGKGQCIVIDQAEGTWHQGIPHDGRAVFSPDSKRMAYPAERGEERVVVVDGKAQNVYTWLDPGSIVFSPDSRRLAYVAIERGILDDRHIVVVDGRRGKLDANASITALTFSPDSKRVAYIVWRSLVRLQLMSGVVTGHNEAVVVDGVAGKTYDDVSSLTFSPDSRRLAYVGLRGVDRIAVIDGRAGKAYAGVSAAIFSPDSRHAAYSTCSKAGVNSTVIDGVECMNLPCAGMLFAGPNTLHVVSPVGRTFVLVKVRIAPAARAGK